MEAPDLIRLYDQAVAAWEMKNFKLALSYVDQALSIKPFVARYRRLRGMIYEEIGQPDLAEIDYLMAVGIRPDWPKGLCSIGMFYYEKQEYGKANKYFFISSELEPDPEVFTLLANINLNENPETALKFAEKALILRPDWEEAVNLRADALKILNSTPKNR